MQLRRCFIESNRSRQEKSNAAYRRTPHCVANDRFRHVCPIKRKHLTEFPAESSRKYSTKKKREKKQKIQTTKRTIMWIVLVILSFGASVNNIDAAIGGDMNIGLKLDISSIKKKGSN